MEAQGDKAKGEGPGSREKLSDIGKHLPHSWDVIVVGLGAFGSSAAYHLARLGAGVLGIDAAPHPGHALGSSHGHSRIIRLAYREGAGYVPLLRRSYGLFQALQEEWGSQLFYKTGMLDIGPDECTGTALASAQQHALPYELLSAREVNKRFPGYHLPDNLTALYQPDGGMLNPEACIQAHCCGAEAASAHLLWGERVRSWRVGGRTGDVRVELTSGITHTAKQLLIAAGPWISDLVPETKRSLTVVRQVVGWFAIKQPGQCFHPSSFPVFILDPGTQGAGGRQGMWYGFPQWGQQPGFKIGLYNHLNEVVHPDQIDRSLTHEDEEALRAAVRTYFPAADGPLLQHSVCMFTNSPDGAFVIDRHPQHPQVYLCSACSGHGFKMSSGVGQLIAQDMLRTGANGLEELAMHRLKSRADGALWGFEAQGHGAA